MKNEIKQLKLTDKKYPKQLKEISASPKILYYRGNLNALDYKHAASVVGTRRCSQYGREATENITKKLAHAGLTIISGLARGIDTYAHQTALEYGTPTIAILGTGVDDKSLYPKQNLRLAHKIIESGGLIMSEYIEGTQGFPGNFPTRNRIVAALSDATIVTEAPIKSGALITAKFAKQYNKKVYAVPGSIFSRLSGGTNYLLQNGASATTDGKNILQDLSIKITNEENLAIIKNKKLDKLEERVLKLISESPIELHIDKIIQKLNVDSSAMSVSVTSLVLNDLIKEVSPNCYIASQ